MNRLVLPVLLTVWFSLPVWSAEKVTKSESSKKWYEYFTGGSESRKKSKVPEPKSTSEKFSFESNPESMVDLVDAPTANVIDYGGYRLNFRLYSKGGVIGHLSFGVFRRLNIGASWDNEEVIGSETPTTNKPTLNLKFRAYDGSNILPSVAIGFDGQGRFFDKTLDEYREREKGLYIAMTREIIFPRLEIHAGGNIAQFKDGIVNGFTGLSYAVEKRLALVMEYDNIRVGPQNRWNAGVRVMPIPSLSIDFAFRRIASNQDKERVVRINYVGSF